MYFSTEEIKKSIDFLSENVHPFLGITYLTCKKNKFEVGKTETVSLDKLTNNHLNKYHKLEPTSSYFFQPFKTSANSKRWVSTRYASTGLQKANTQTFGGVFIHPRGSRQWGFSANYIEKIQSILYNNGFDRKVFAWPLIVWIFKEENLGENTDPENLLDEFYKFFNIEERERNELFIDDFSDVNEFSFSDEPAIIGNVLSEYPSPDDANQELGRSLTYLSIKESSLADHLEMNFGERLSLITGDNGLGKSLMLEVAWWVATATWSHMPVLPNIFDPNNKSSIFYTLLGNNGRTASGEYIFDSNRYEWKAVGSAPSVDALCIFSRADGSFSVFDSARMQLQKSNSIEKSVYLSNYEVWNGKERIIEGLIRDWVNWERSDDQINFDRFSSVLKTLSPEDLGQLIPGTSVRLPGDSREIPTIQHDYGTVPVIHASAGVRRILLLTYLIIWSWKEHEIASEQLDKEPLKRLVLFVDEIEAHLHPKWQRIILPALMRVGDLLGSKISIQTIAATHSPMILASLEPLFNKKEDKLFHLYTNRNQVKLEETSYIRYGDAARWLTSPLFGLRHARSREAEKAIEKAKALQKINSDDQEEIREVTNELASALASDDKFWSRWLYFAEARGVTL